MTTANPTHRATVARSGFLRPWLIWTAGFLAFPASSGRLAPRRWIPVTATGMGLGLALGATVVDFGTGRADLALMGALTGVFLGTGQALVLPAPGPAKALWTAAVTGLWALGWTVTELVGVDVERQYTVFGASGAITVSALAGLLLHTLLRKDES